MEQVIFTETQKLGGSFITWVVLGILVLAAVVLFFQKKSLAGGMIILIAFGFTAIAHFTIKITQADIMVQWFPFVNRVIHKNEIGKAYVREYNAVQEYRGWGIKQGPGGMSYSVSGNQGVQLELNSGEKILIGSQQPNELLTAILK